MINKKGSLLLVSGALLSTVLLAQPVVASTDGYTDLVVQYSSAVTPQDVDVTDEDVVVIGDTVFQRMEVLDTVSADTVATSLEQSPFIEAVELDIQAEIAVTPDDTNFSSQDHHNGTAASISSPEAWDRQIGDSTIVVAVIDSGVDTDHPDIAANMWANVDETPSDLDDDDSNGYDDDYYGYDFVDSDADPNPAPDGIDGLDSDTVIDDGVTHGTHVAGLIAAVGNNTEGVSGVVWDTQIMALRALDDEGGGSFLDIAEAVTYAVNNGADIINMSLGGYGISSAMTIAVAYAQTNDVLVFAAMGNDSFEVDTSAPATTYYPACADGVVAVVAINDSAEAASFTNYGDCADVAAPGVSILSTLYTNDIPYNFTDDYGYISGTSMASPIAAGVAAMLLAEFPTEDPDLLQSILVTNSVPMSIGSKYGSGRVDSLAAMEAVDTYIGTGPVITSTGGTTTTVECASETYAELGATASDAEDGDVSGTVTIDNSSVNEAVPASYAVEYTATDSRTNVTSQNRTVVVEDTVAPVVTLGGEASVTVPLGTTFVDEGATAVDACDSAVSMVTTGTVDAATSGTYTVTYTVTDESGNSGIAVRTVTVPSQTAKKIKVLNNTSLKITYKDGSTNTIVLFSQSSNEPTALLDKNTNSIVAIKSNGRKIKTINAATGETVTQKTTHAQKRNSVLLKTKDINSNGKIEVIISSHRKSLITVISYRLSPQSKLTKRSTVTVAGKPNYKLKAKNGFVRVLSNNAKLKAKWRVNKKGYLKEL